MSSTLRQAITARLNAYNNQANDQGIMTHAFLHLFALEDGVLEADNKQLGSVAATLLVAFRNLGTANVPPSGVSVGTMMIAYAELMVAMTGDKLSDEKKDKLLGVAVTLARMFEEVDTLTAVEPPEPALQEEADGDEHFAST
jgi:hypothetical protein